MRGAAKRVASGLHSVMSSSPGERVSMDLSEIDVILLVV